MSRVYPIRAEESERARWQRVADFAGLSFNAWAKRSLNRVSELEAALMHLEQLEETKGELQG